MLEIGYDEIKRRAPWPAEAGEKTPHQDNAERDGEGTKAAEPRPETVRFQGMRVAYFCVDPDSPGDSIVLNRIVSLKEDTGKE